MDLPSLDAMLLLKLPSMDLQYALSTLMVWHTALLLIKGIYLTKMKCHNGPMLMEFTDLTKCPMILK